MDTMHEQDDALNVKVILLAVGGAALAAVLVALARRDDETPKEHVEAAVHDVEKNAKKAAKAVKKQRKEAMAAASKFGDRVVGDAKAAERELKAAAWDAQQEAKEAEGRLRGAGHRVVDDAAHLASKVGAEARNLAEEGRERISHLRHRDDGDGAVDREVERLRAEIEDLRSQLGGAGRKAERDTRGLASRLTGKGAARDDMASQAAAAALAQLERSLKAKAPELLAARNRAQVLEVLQKDLGPTLRESAMQAAMAALGMWETGKDRARDAADDVRESAHHLRDDARDKARSVEDEARHVVEDAEKHADAVAANGKRRFWRASHEAHDEAERASGRIDVAAHSAEEAIIEEEQRGKAGLFWGGAGLGLALYALLDAERREKVLHFANEASVQVQELVRDIQGYDDEF